MSITERFVEKYTILDYNYKTKTDDHQIFGIPPSRPKSLVPIALA